MAVDPRQELLAIYADALEAVSGERSVVHALDDACFEGDWHVVAIGKAAASMWRGARRVLDDRLGPSLVITKHGHGDGLEPGPALELIEADHPVPGEASLHAGRRLLAFLDTAPADARFLFLISGGCSSLVEVLPAGVETAQLTRLNRWLLGSGLDIAAINAVRRRLSRIKGGGLLHWLGSRQVLCLLMSDVPNDDPAVIGSGLLVPTPPAALPAGLPDWLTPWLDAAPANAPVVTRGPGCRIIASCRHALTAAAQAAAMRGFAVHRRDTLLQGDAAEAGARIAAELAGGAAGIHLWTGETTVQLPEAPGRGGRNQHFALAAALGLAGQEGVYLLAAGTDGTDGPTEDAGALVDGRTIDRMPLEECNPRAALMRADAGTCLEASGDLVQTGPTGTNVMDLVIGLKTEAG